MKNLHEWIEHLLQNETMKIHTEDKKEFQSNNQNCIFCNIHSQEESIQ